MKHKSDFLTISKIIAAFENKDTEDKIIAIIRNLPPSQSPPKTILASHFEVLMMQLNYKTLSEKDFVLQKFQPTQSYSFFIAKFVLPDITVQTKPMSTKYLINGKYLNEELMSEAKVQENNSAEVQKSSHEIIKYLCKVHGKIVSCELEWFEDLNKNIYLVDIYNVTEGVTLAGKKIVRSVSENMPPAKASSRPITARSNDKNFRFTPMTDGEMSKIILDASSYTTPRSFKLSYEFKNKCLQTNPLPCCQYKDNLQNCKDELIKAVEKQEILQKQLKDIIMRNEDSLEEIDEYWKAKCLELSNSLAERMHGERKKYESKIRSLKRRQKNAE